MFRSILRSAIDHAKRFIAVWLLILGANQLFLFGACFAPHCLAAALPHTFVLAALVNWLGFRRDASVRPTAGPGDVSGASSAAPPGQRQFRARHAVLLALVAIGLVLVLLLSGRSGPGQESSSTLAENAQAPLAEARIAQMPAQRADYLEADDDEFDVNDIETYERLTRTPYRGATVYDRQEIDRKEEGDKDSGTVDQGVKLAEMKAGDSAKAHAARASVQQAYACSNSSGNVGRGTGRLSQEREYSSFLKREVRAGEFVLFTYEGGGRQYWFRSSNCARL